MQLRRYVYIGMAMDGIYVIFTILFEPVLRNFMDYHQITNTRTPHQTTTNETTKLR